MDQADPKQCDILTQEVLVIAKSWSEKNVKFGVNLANAAPNMFTFLRYPGMAPTNNAAEHAIRQAVLHRKIKGKLNNWKGMRRLGIMLTYFGTMRKRGLNPSKELVKILTRNDLENLA